jgi:hypothetical protein
MHDDKHALVRDRRFPGNNRPEAAFSTPSVLGQNTLRTQLEIISQVLSQDNPLDPKTWTYGFTLLDQSSGNIWAYPVFGPNAFANPTLIGTLQQAGAPIARPPQTPGSAEK